MLALQMICAVSLTAAGVVCLYHLFLAVVGLATYGRSADHRGAGVHRFAIAIPAHDEQGTVERLLRCCAELDYPREKYAVYVIADNCSDRTAEVAQAHGAVCLVRRDEQRRGKGFALEWALPRILADGHDAIVVLDADCQMDRQGLRVFDGYLQSGDRVLQANNVVANPDDSPVSYVLALASLLANDLFHAPKSVLGLPGLLLGCGMVLHREVLERLPWRAQSLCEDTEQSLLLDRHGVPIRYVPEVRVSSDFPIRRRELVVQRRRWISGGLQLAWNYGAKLIWEGLREGKWKLLDAGFTTLVLSRPVVLGHLLFTGACAVLCQWCFPGPLSRGLLLGTLAVTGAYVVYTAVGMCLLGLTVHRARLLLCSPLVVFGYLLLAAETLLRSRPTSWDRTPRLSRPPQS